MRKIYVLLELVMNLGLSQNIFDLPNVTNVLKILPEKWRGLKLLSTF
jgi:hypothetical protein